MKKLKTLLFATTFILLFYSCTETGQIQVNNNTKLMMENVMWGDVLISERILTGETSEPVTIKINKNTATENAISFESTNDDYYIFAKTKRKFKIIENKTRTITMLNDTPLNINTKPR